MQIYIANTMDTLAHKQQTANKSYTNFPQLCKPENITSKHQQL